MSALDGWFDVCRASTRRDMDGPEVALDEARFNRIVAGHAAGERRKAGTNDSCAAAPTGSPAISGSCASCAGGVRETRRADGRAVPSSGVSRSRQWVRSTARAATR